MTFTKGGFKAEYTGVLEYLYFSKKKSKPLFWVEDLNKLFTGKFKFSAQDSKLEYYFLRSKIPSVSSDLKPTLSNCQINWKIASNFVAFIENVNFKSTFEYLQNDWYAQEPFEPQKLQI